MKTKTNSLLGAALSLLVTFALTQNATAQTPRIVFYAPVIATNVSHKTHSISYTTSNQIMTMNEDGTDVRQLTTGTEDCFFPSWRPGQTHILFHSGNTGGTLYVMDKDGGGTFAVTPDVGAGADWSPDGNFICYVGDAASPPGPNGLWVVSVDPSARGNKKVGTPVLVSEGNFYAPVWSPDGSRIAFSSWAHINILELATGTQSSLDSMQGLLPSWNSDGSQIAFSGVTETEGWQLFIMNADFSGNTQVTSYFPNSVLWPVWSPDDTQVAFRIGSGKNWDASIYKLTLATGELTLLRDKADHPDWRP